DFLKKIGSNRILREREVYINPENEWKILWNLPAEARSAEAISGQPTMWLRRADPSIKTRDFHDHQNLFANLMAFT
ncbi:hypothetical protein KKG58_03895, partial [Patescibacteria group bacterium]|nr:hypothetical protein [Patescibacteria group bacterium]